MHPNIMRAAQYSRFGGPDVIEIADVPVPRPQADEVLVRVRVTSVNGGEVAIRAGRLRIVSGRRFPRGLGIDFAGEVIAVGASVQEPIVGAKVWGMLDNRTVVRGGVSTGAAAQYVIVKATLTAPMPDKLDPVQAVSLLAGNGAFAALRDRAGLRAGERLLVRGGTGGVGFVAVQVGRSMRAEVTTLVSAPNIGTAKALGADIALDHRATSPGDIGEFDVIFDTVGSDMEAYRRRLAPEGRMIAISANPPIRGFMAVFASSFRRSRRIQYILAEPTRALLDDYAELIASGEVTPLIASERPLEELADAHRAFERGGRAGKHLVHI